MFPLIHSARLGVSSAVVVLLIAAVAADAVQDVKFERGPSEQRSRGHYTHVTPEIACGEGFCLIDSRCIPAGHRDTAPDASCWTCDPSRSTVAWSFLDGANCGVPGWRDAAAGAAKKTVEAEEEEEGVVRLDTWHLSLIIVGSVLLVVMLVMLASYRLKRHLAKRQRVYPHHIIDVPYDRPLLKHMGSL